MIELMPIIKHPAFSGLAFVLLSLWPVAHIFKRRSQSPWLALLMVLNFLLPFLGIIAVSAAMLRKKAA